MEERHVSDKIKKGARYKAWFAYHYISHLFDILRNNADSFLLESRNRVIDRPYAALQAASDNDSSIKLDGDLINDIQSKLDIQLEGLYKRRRLITYIFIAIFTSSILHGSYSQFFNIKISDIAKLNDFFILAYCYNIWTFVNTSIICRSYESIIFNYFKNKSPNETYKIQYAMHTGLDLLKIEAMTYGSISLTEQSRTAIKWVNKIDGPLSFFTVYIPPLFILIASVYNVFNPPLHFAISLCVLLASIPIMASSFLKIAQKKKDG